MDAKIGDWVVTPRIGKPVEIQALWINALRIGGAWSPDWADLARRAHGVRSAPAFPNPATGGLVRCGRRRPCAGHAWTPACGPTRFSLSAACRFRCCTATRARRRRPGRTDAADAAGLAHACRRTIRTIAPHYRGGAARARRRLSSGHRLAVADGAVRRGVAARARGTRRRRNAEARRRFLPPLLAHLATCGLGHVSEVADGDPPHTPGGCPFQAWSLGELIRIERMLAAADGRGAPSRMPTTTSQAPRHVSTPPKARRLAATRRTRPGGAGGPISATGNGARCARTTAQTAPPGSTCRTITPAAAPTAGAKTGSAA